MAARAVQYDVTEVGDQSALLLPGCEAPELDVPCGDVSAGNRSLSGDCNHPEVRVIVSGI